MPGNREVFTSHFDVSRETIARLDVYEVLLKKWNPRINLVSRSTLDDIWCRHFLDSAQVWHHIPTGATKWLDFGSGAGFPGLVCAVIAREKNPDLEFVLVESDQRKCAFLMNASRELGLKARILSQRIEDIPPQHADIISARAVASLRQLLTMSLPHTYKSSVLLFPKGNSYESELTEARKHWHIDAQVIESLTDSGSVILKIEEFERAK